MSVINQNLLLTPEGYQISRSVRLRSSASAYLSRTPSVAGNSQKFTYSAWVKLGALGSTAEIFSANGSASLPYFDIRYGFSVGDGKLSVDFGPDTTRSQNYTTAVYRDPSAWYHVVVAVDTTQATAANRLLIYVNGVSQAYSSTATIPQNLSTNVNTTTAHAIGRRVFGSDFYFDGCLTEVNFIDGQALTPSSFGETDAVTGVWKPKKYAGTYGTNGFYLNFSDNSAATAAAIGKDSSGNGNNWTPNNISVTAGVTYDSMLDVPTLYADGGNGRGNYAVINPISTPAAGGVPAIADGNLRMVGGTANSGGAWSTIALPTSGQFYAESTVEFTTGSYQVVFGIADNNSTSTVIDVFVGDTSANQVRVNGSNVQAFTPASGDVFSFAVDCGTGVVVVRRNNTTIYTSTSLAVADKNFFFYRSSNGGQRANFGQRPFAYTPPTGFKALNTQNLPEPTIKKGNQYFNAVTWTGANSTGSRSVTGVGFQPDFVWAKRRDAAADHLLYDAIRGAGSNKELTSSSTAAEGGTNADSYDYLSSFDSDGFSSTWSGSNTAYYFNTLNATYVAWNWKANGAGSSNTAGSITATVSANASAGFSISTYTGTGANATIGHGLGVAPKMVIVKNKSSGSAFWTVYHSGLTSATYAVFLNATNAQSSSATYWNSTAPASSVFSVGTSPETNANGSTYVAYLFAEVSQFSKAFSFTGNGSTDGVFVHVGFLPRLILLKRTDTTGNWYLWDTARNTYNVLGEELYPNLSNAAASATDLDVLSNGFKIRNSTAGFNASGGTYIGFAWASNPFKYSLGF